MTLESETTSFIDRNGVPITSGTIVSYTHNIGSKVLAGVGIVQFFSENYYVNDVLLSDIDPNNINVIDQTVDNTLS